MAIPINLIATGAYEFGKVAIALYQSWAKGDVSDEEFTRKWDAMIDDAVKARGNWKAAKAVDAARDAEPVVAAPAAGASPAPAAGGTNAPAGEGSDPAPSGGQDDGSGGPASPAPGGGGI